jgi:hypothetical protein
MSYHPWGIGGADRVHFSYFLMVALVFWGGFIEISEKLGKEL